MFGKGFGAPEIILIIFVILLLFGARKLPETAKGLGQALKIFKKEVKDEDRPTPEINAAQTPAPPTVTAEPIQQPVQPPVQEHDHPQR